MSVPSGNGGPADERDELVALFARWRDNGDEEAFATLLCRIVEELKRHLRRKGRKRRTARDDASDIADSAIGRLLGRLRKPLPPRFGSLREFRAYLITIVENLLNSRGKAFAAQGLEANLPDIESLLAASSLSGMIDRREEIRVVRTALRMVSPITRDLVLSKMNNEPLAELAARIGISVDAARMRRKRAIADFTRVLRLLLDP